MATFFQLVIDCHDPSALVAFWQPLLGGYRVPDPPAPHPTWRDWYISLGVPAAEIDPDPEELRAHVRKHLRGSRTPDHVVFRKELPTNATGKILRREIVDSLRNVNAEK